MIDLGEESVSGTRGLFTFEGQRLFQEEANSATQSKRTPAIEWERDAAKHALDDLFSHTIQYRSSKAYHELLKFISRFRWYSPFNAMLVHIQMPGAVFVAPAHRWVHDYGRTIKPGARPLVILQPMGPVMFVFDVSDTKGKSLPPEVENPFAVWGPRVGARLKMTIENSKRDGVAIHTARLGSQQAGSIERASEQRGYVEFCKTWVPIRYELELDQNASEESRYASLVHELGHLYCGHLGTPNPKWWPDRHRIDTRTAEFEAESVAYLVCSRAGIDSHSAQYLASYVEEHQEIPSISLDCVMKVAGLIESMGISTLKPRERQTIGREPVSHESVWVATIHSL